MALMITMSKSADAAKKYFAEHLRQSDYLSEGGARPGIAFGKGAERLGISGEMTAEEFIALADNKDPRTGKRLTVRDVANARPGYDFTFSGPKSFASMWARTGDERLIEALRESILETIAEDIEPEMKTRLRRGGQDKDVVTGNLVGNLFLHDTTRPLKEDKKPDPHPHGHAYIFNRTWAPHENRWQAAQLGDLHLDGRYFEAAFEARLGRRVRRLGYELAPDGKGSWEIVGVPQSVIEKFSRRTFQEIEPEAKRRGLTGAAKAKLAKETRQEKEDGENLSGQELHDYWNGRLTADEAQALDAVYARAQAGGGTEGQAVVTAQQADRHAVEHFFGPDGRDSAVAEKAVLEEALRYGAGNVLPEDVKRELARRNNLIRAEIDGRMICTTEEVHAEERAMSKAAWRGRNACDPLDCGKPYVPQGNLDEEQHEAVGQLMASQDRVMMLLGKSGAGKTTTLRAFEEALHERGRRMSAFAPTTKARDTLRGKGFETAETLQALLASPKLQEQVKGHVVMVDEAGMAGTRASRQLLDLVEKHQKEGYDTRVLYVGDEKQHRGVPRGQVLTILQEQAGITPARLSTIRRQKDNPGYLKAVELLSEGKTGDAFDLLDKLGFIQEIPDAQERYRAMARDYADRLAAGQSEMIVSPTHAEGRAVSEAVRAELRARQMLGPEDRPFVRYESKQLTIAQRKDAAQYQSGDMVHWGQNAPGFQRGQKVTVIGQKGGRVTVKDTTGQARELPLQLADRFELYQTTTIGLAEGDRVRITRNGTTAGKKAHTLKNGEVVKIARITDAGNIVDHRGWEIPASYGHLAYGVVTSHGSQSAEDEVPFLAQSGMSRGASSAEQFYVSVSRGTKALRVYTDDKEALRAAVRRSDKARSAAEVWEASQAQRPKQEAANQAAWQRMWRAKKARRAQEAARETAMARGAEKERQQTAARREMRGPIHAQ
jgi:conjugative relaxase-like TrwC/TraI family protein